VTGVPYGRALLSVEVTVGAVADFRQAEVAAPNREILGVHGAIVVEIRGPRLLSNQQRIDGYVI